MSVFGVFLVRIQSECGKIRTWKTPNTFHAVFAIHFKSGSGLISCLLVKLLLWTFEPLSNFFQLKLFFTFTNLLFNFAWNIIVMLGMVLFVTWAFCKFYLAAPRPTLGHYHRDSLTHSMFITAFIQILPGGYREPRNENGSLSPAEHLVGFEPGTLRLWLQRINPLCHSSQIVSFREVLAHGQNLTSFFF